MRVGDAVTARAKSENVLLFRSECGCHGHETLKLDASHPAEHQSPKFQVRDGEDAQGGEQPTLLATIMSSVCASL